MKRNSLLFCTLVGLLAAGVMVAGAASKADTPAAAPSIDPHASETKAQRDSRMAWWRQARFGMFIHWGLYAVPAGSGTAKTQRAASARERRMDYA